MDRDRILLRNQLLDLQRRFKRLLEEKEKVEKEARDNYESNIKIEDELMSEIRRLEDELDKIQKQLRNVDDELINYTDLIINKDAELEKLKRDYALLQDNNMKESSEKRGIEVDLERINKNRIDVEKESGNLSRMNETLDNERAVLMSHVRDAEREITLLNKEIDNTTIKFQLAKKKISQTEMDLEIGRAS